MDKKDFKIVLISLFGLDFGVYAVSSFLQTKGHTPYIIEFNHLKIPMEFIVNDYFTRQLINHDLFPKNDLELLLNLLTEIKPNIIGVSVSSVCFRTASWLTREIKKDFSTPIVWGGIHAIISPEDCIKEVDIVCTGEGEHPFYEIAEKIRHHQPVEGIKNTWIRIENKIEKNPMRELIIDLDSLPLADRINGENKYFIDRGTIVNNPIINAGYMTNAYPMMTSRGCMYACSYCCNSIIREKYKGCGPYLRRRSVNHVIGELKDVVRHTTIGTVRFWDDIFTYDEEWIDEFCRRYPYEVGKSFICYGHPKHTKYEVLEKLSKVGLILLYVGIQSGSENTNRVLFKRKQLNEDVIKFSKYAKALQITINYDIITDNCFEDAKDNYYTSELLLNVPRPYKVLFFSLCFFPKTPLSNRALKDRMIQECDLEHLVAKAINNFFLVIPKAQDTYQMFWDCIKAMAVNPYFPQFIVRLCRNSRFFKKRPYLLFTLCRMWLMLFKQRGKMKVAHWLMPALVEKSFLNNSIVWIGNKHLYRQNLAKYIVFPTGENKQRNSFCFRINCNNVGHRQRRNIEGFQVELIQLKERNLQRKNIWRLKYPIVLSKYKEIMFNLEFPNMYCKIDNKYRKMSSIKVKSNPSSEETPYIFKIKIIKRGNFMPFKLNKFLVGTSLCLIKTKCS